MSDGMETRSTETESGVSGSTPKQGSVSDPVICTPGTSGAAYPLISSNSDCTPKSISVSGDEPQTLVGSETLYDPTNQLLKESMSHLHIVQIDCEDSIERMGKINASTDMDREYCNRKDETTSTESNEKMDHTLDNTGYIGSQLSSTKSISDQTVSNSLFDDLPNELINYIFSFLSTQDLGRVSSVCKKFHMHASDPVFWTKIVFKREETNINEVCCVIEQFPFIEEIHFLKLYDLSDEDVRQVMSVCPSTVKSLNIGFKQNLGRDSILAILEYLPNLRELNMEGCSAVNNNSVTALVKLKSLTHLNISHCSLVDDIHVQMIVSNLPFLEVLNIDGLADVSETAIKRLWQHCGTWLRELHVDGASLTDLAMEYVSRCTELQTFTLSFGDNITDEGLRKIMGMKKLTTLKMRKCSGFSTETIVECFGSNEALAELVVFDMSECIEFNDTAVKALMDRCPKLRELSLAWCWEISDVGIQDIVQHCSALRHLDLAGLDKIKGDAFEATPEKMPELVYLNLGQCNNVNDELLLGVKAKMPRLTAYNYYGQKFGEEERLAIDDEP